MLAVHLGLNSFYLWPLVYSGSIRCKEITVAYNFFPSFTRGQHVYKSSVALSRDFLRMLNSRIGIRQGFR